MHCKALGTAIGSELLWSRDGRFSLQPTQRIQKSIHGLDGLEVRSIAVAAVIKKTVRLSFENHDFTNDAKAARQLITSAQRTDGDAALIAVANVLLNLDEALMKP